MNGVLVDGGMGSFSVFNEGGSDLTKLLKERL